MTQTLPAAESLLAQLIETMRPRLGADVSLVGIHTGGVWLAERLHAALNLTAPLGSIDVSFYRDDFGSRGLAGGIRRSAIPFAVDGAHIVIVDDVLHTGRTTRAAMNELFDYGRPKRIELAVLVDRGGRELPIAADYCALAHRLLPSQNLVLERGDNGLLNLRISDE
jgi:pyrimidine operon attenuation protein/uracil phosphoribosyltransferase